MADSRLDKLEAVVREMRKRLEPQAMRDSLERAWDPRGYADWTRVTGSAGAPASPPRRLLQFPGATITDNPATGDRGATVVTISPSTDLVGVFAGAPQTQRVRFTATPGGTPVRGHITTANGAAGTGSVMTWETHITDVDAPGAIATTYIAISSRSTTEGITTFLPDNATTNLAVREEHRWSGATGNNGVGTNGARHTIFVQRPAGGGIPAARIEHRVTNLTGGLSAALYVNVTDAVMEAKLLSPTGEINCDFNGAHVNFGPAPVPARDVYTLTSTSNFVQNETSTADATPTRRVRRGAFVAAPGAIAPLGVAAVIVNNALVGAAAAQTVEGVVSGPAGVELVLTSWVAGPGANQVTINFTNTSAVAALAPVFQFATYCAA